MQSGLPDDDMKSVTDPKTSILIVDDSIQYTRVLKMMLESGLGYEDITTVDSTTQAFQLIAKDPERFQLLFIDYNFPDGITGGSLLRELATAQLLDDKIVFLITAEPTIENVAEARSAGALGVVAKPFDRQALTDQLVKADRKLETDAADSF